MLKCQRNHKVNISIFKLCDQNVLNKNEVAVLNLKNITIKDIQEIN